MYYIISGHSFKNDVQTMAQVFLQNQRFIQVEKPHEEGYTVESALDCTFCYAKLYQNGLLVSEKSIALEDNGNSLWLEESHEKMVRRKIHETIFFTFVQAFKYVPPWGILTGIRPAKLASEQLARGKESAWVKDYLTKGYFVSDKKAELALKVALSQQRILLPREDAVSLYIGIPFCPTTCVYCSFGGYSLLQYGGYVEDYLEALFKEIDFIKAYVRNYYLETVYIGGGTPTSLNEMQLDALLKKICESFNIGDAREFTLEAGRPDTITLPKLKIMKNHGVTRISINPQTLNDETLVRIGRQHTAYDFFCAYEKAVEGGFDNINTDIILGLPGEGIQEVKVTLEGITRLNPASITAHVLSVKHGSKLKEQLTIQQLNVNESKASMEIEKIQSMVEEYAQRGSLLPYYMYRQKNMLGSLENVGYAKEGFEGIYNIQIMEEKQTIFALGAGAVTKTYEPSTNKIERIFNVKSVRDYILRIDEMINRKEVGLCKP